MNDLQELPAMSNEQFALAILAAEGKISDAVKGEAVAVVIAALTSILGKALAVYARKNQLESAIEIAIVGMRESAATELEGGHA